MQLFNIKVILTFTVLKKTIVLKKKRIKNGLQEFCFKALCSYCLQLLTIWYVIVQFFAPHDVHILFYLYEFHLFLNQRNSIRFPFFLTFIVLHCFVEFVFFFISTDHIVIAILFLPDAADFDLEPFHLWLSLFALTSLLISSLQSRSLIFLLFPNWVRL